MMRSIAHQTGATTDVENSALVGPVSGSQIDRPICVDLDGTLVNTDLLIEGFLTILSSRRGLMCLPQLLTFSRVDFKRRIGELADLRVELLPYNLELLAFLQEQKQAGRRILLATAADNRTAQAVAKHLGFFDEIISSDGVRNLKGETKSRELVRRFGREGFDYVGNDPADLPVWREAKGIVIVNASRAVSSKARKLSDVLLEIANRPPMLPMALRAMRPQQWVKNLLVFVPLLASRSFGDIHGMLGALCVFASFCMTASGIYLVNDLTDLAADRRHLRKRYRPFASGALPLSFGAGLAAALIATGIASGLLCGAALLIIAYAVVSLSYSLALKQYPLLDVFVLAALYTVRIVAGGIASHHSVTLWLLAFSGFTFLSLALVKRIGEMNLKLSDSAGVLARRGYFPEDRLVLLMFGIASTFASSVVLALYVSSSTAFQQYRTPEILWGLVPLILFWQCRLWLATERGRMHDDPINYAFRDWVSWLVAGSVLIIMLLASVRQIFS
jgi:4-hydroxybenzoate polyprenyltransferase/phosphoserine phosphatase